MQATVEPKPVTARLVARAACGRLKRENPRGHMLAGLADWGVGLVAEYDRGALNQQACAKLLRESESTFMRVHRQLQPHQQASATAVFNALGSVLLTEPQL